MNSQTRVASLLDNLLSVLDISVVFGDMCYASLPLFEQVPILQLQSHTGENQLQLLSGEGSWTPDRFTNSVSHPSLLTQRAACPNLYVP